MTERDCKHGRLARSCETCAMEEEIDDLKYELGVAREAQQCECSSDDACRFARERDALQKELAALQKKPVVLSDIEQYRMQIAAICTAAIGYWAEGDPIHPDYDTMALRDVARLYAKYAEQYDAKEKTE